jgi:N-acetylmuramoyl-L-alanine amidase
VRVVAVVLASLLAGCTSAVSDRPDGSGADVVTSASPSTSSAPPVSRTATHPSKRARPARTRTHHRTTAPAPAPSPSPSPTVVLPKVSPGLTVVLNPGHNGADWSHPAQINRQVPSGYGMYKDCDTTGTNTNAGYPEHAFNWDVALRVRALLRARGVHVIMTRPNDSGVGPCVDERAAIGNQPGVDAVVSIHADGADAAGHGFHVNQDSRRPDGATAATARASIRLGRAIHDALARSSGLVPSTYIGTNGYYYRSDLAGLNLATKPATFLELGNMRNAGDAALQSSAAGRQRIAQAVAAGILAYLGR